MAGNGGGTTDKKDEDSRIEVQNLEDNFDNIPEKERNELLLKLSRKSEFAGKLAWIISSNFEKISVPISNELLLELSKRDKASIAVAWTVQYYFDKIPDNVRNKLLPKLTEKADVGGTVANILERNFDKIPDITRNELLFNLSKYDMFAGEVARIISENFYKLPENIRNLLFQLYTNKKSAGNVVRAIVKKFDKLPEDVGVLLLVKIYEKFGEISAFYNIPLHVRTKLPENIRNLLIRKDSSRYKHPALAEYDPPEGTEELRVELEPELEKMMAEKPFPKPMPTKAKPLEALKDEIPTMAEPPEEETQEAVKKSSLKLKYSDVWLDLPYKYEPEDGAIAMDKDKVGVPIGRMINNGKHINVVSPDEAQPRYADFTFNHDNGGKPGRRLPEGHTLQSGQSYLLEVAVRVNPIGISFEGEKHDPLGEPKQEQPVTIIVTAEAEDSGFIEIEEPTQELTLPPLGDSTKNALFSVRPLRQSASSNDIAQIRIRLYYEFNLIEVAIINAEVVGKFDNPTKSQLGLDKPVWFVQERRELYYQDFDKIMPRDLHIDINKKGETFLFTFAFFKSPDQKIVLTASAHLPASHLEDLLINIRKIWYEIAMSETFTLGLEGEKNEFIESIRTLAKAGQKLWTNLFMLEKDTSIYRIGEWLKNHAVRQDGIVQVSLNLDATSFVFPWALLYDRDIPSKDYELPELDGFWGLRYCIEQQLPNRNKGTDEPIKIADRLKLRFMLWEAFRNADKEISFLENLKVRSAGHLEITPPIMDADDCMELLSNCDAHILYFYTHGYTRHHLADIGVGLNLDLFIRRYESLDENSPMREINRLLYESIKQKKFEPDSSWIELSNGKLYLEELYYKIRDLQSHPFVILNMCESAQVTPSLTDSFIHFFLTRGASGVIGTECPMTIEFAHPFAEKFLEDLLDGEQVGRVLLNARRHFIGMKNPLGLAYTLFGPATVRFEPKILIDEKL